MTVHIDVLRAKARRELAELDVRLAELKARCESASEETQAAVRREIAAAEAKAAWMRGQLDAARGSAAEAGAELGDRVSAAWAEISAGVRRAYDRLAA